MIAPRPTPLVLVVDDDPTTGRTLRSILTRAGFRCVVATDVASALQEVAQSRPHLILLDVNLPDGSGFDVCRALQADAAGANTPVLFISASDDTATKVRGFEAGGVDFITKPLAAAEIVARVSTHLRLRQAQERLVELQAEQIGRLAGAQETLMPSPDECPDAGFQVSLQQILQAGGDFYDVISVGNQLVDYIVADASGHDLAASFWTAALKTLLTEYATPASQPREVMQSINRALCRILPEGSYFTVLYARLNRLTNHLSFVNAGHPPALVVDGRTRELRVVNLESDVAGAFPDASFATADLKVRPGDRFFLFSDGLIEQNGPRQSGLQHLSEACRARHTEPLDQAVHSIHRSVVNGAQPLDDILLLGVEV